MTTTAVQITSRLGPGDERTLAEDVLDGLTRPAKELPSKHFYDARGSELFERITEVPEYYPTRTERWILEAISGQIAEHTGASELVELGAGYATKTRVLLDAMAANGTLRSYVPLDVSEATVLASAAELVDEYPGLQVHGVIGDFERHLDALPEPAGPRIVALLGGTVGNFLPGARRRFLRSVRRQLGPDDRLLLGTDLVKDPRIIEAAYDDSQGITAAFNLNILTVCNRELRRRLRRRPVRARRLLPPAPPVDRDAPAGGRPLHGRPQGHRPAGRVRGARGDAHGAEREVHAASAWRPTCSPPGCGWTASTPTRSGCSRSPSGARSPRRRRVPARRPARPSCACAAAARRRRAGRGSRAGTTR